MIKYDKISEWGMAKANLDHWKAREAELRLEICKDMFDNRIGRFTVTQVLDAGEIKVQVKAKSVTNFSLDEEMLQNLFAQDKLTLEDMACFQTKLVIKDSVLMKRPGGSAIWHAVTEKPGMPKLEVKAINED